MGFIGDIIKTIINWAVFLAMIGALKSATLIMAGKAATAHQRGLISLSDLNRGLMGKKKYCRNRPAGDPRCK